jgi:hypothetical protein
MTQGLNSGADHSSDNLNDALRTLTSELARADAKASIVLAMTRVALGFVAAQGSKHQGATVLSVGAAGSMCLVIAIVVLLITVRPAHLDTVTAERLVALGDAGARGATRPHARGSARRAGCIPLPRSHDQVPQTPSRNQPHPGWRLPAMYCRCAGLGPVEPRPRTKYRARLVPGRAGNHGEWRGARRRLVRPR